MQTDRILRLRLDAASREDGADNRAPVAYGYSRVSHQNSFKKGDSLPAQEHRIKLYYKNFLEEKGIEFGGVENDGINVSAYSVPFAMRPAGKIILQKLKPGDHLILDKIDRIWRSIEDFCNLMRHFRQKQITVHIVNFLGQSVQNDTPLGDFILRQFVLVAELESAIKSERIKEGLSAHYHKYGYYTKRPVLPPGTMRVKKKVMPFTEHLEWDLKERAVMAELVRLKDEENLKWGRKLYQKIEEFEAKVYGREPRPMRSQEYDRNTKWPRFYKWETAYRYLQLEDPMTIPPRDIVIEAARQYRREKIDRKCRARGSKKKASVIEKISREELLGIA